MLTAKSISWNFFMRIAGWLLLFVVGSCSQDYLPEPKLSIDPKDAYALSVRFSVLPPQTRAPEEAANHYDPLNENVINNMAILFYEGGNQRGLHSTIKGDLVLFPASGVGSGAAAPHGTDKADALQGIARLYVPKNTPVNPYQNKTLSMVVIANYHGDIEELRGLSLTQLQARMANEANNLGTQDDPTKKQTDFLMNAAVETGHLNWSAQDEIALSQTVTLQRAAAKVRFRLRSPLNIKDAAGKPLQVVGAPQLALVNGVSNTLLLSEQMQSLSTRTWVNGGQTSFQTLGLRNYDGKSFYARQVPFYVYANDWRNDINTRTFLLVKLRLKEPATGKEFDSFYNVPVNYLVPPRNTPAAERDNYARILRNSVYDIECDIQEIGSVDPENPTDLNAGIAVEQWTSPKAIDGSIALAHYLLVKEPNPEMLAEKEIDIQYLSDLPLNPSVLNQIKTAFTAYTQWGDEDPHTGNNEKKEIKVTTIERDGKRYIHVESPVPINYVPQTIEFTAQHINTGSGVPLRQHIKITQFPPIYVTAKKSKGNPIYWYSDFTYWFPTGFYLENGELKYGAGGAGYQRNSTLYTVHVIAAQEGMIVGDPTLGATNQQTAKTEEANKITSPEFMIASQWGLTVQIPQYVDYNHPFGTYYPGWLNAGATNYYDLVNNSPKDEHGAKLFTHDNLAPFRYRNYRVAADHALNYWEDDYGVSETKQIYGQDNATYPDYYTRHPRNFHFNHNAHWRIPSLAELKLINKIQKDQNSAVKALLFGRAYWSAQENIAYSFENNQNIVVNPYANPTQYFAVRPVFDTYKY